MRGKVLAVLLSAWLVASVLVPLLWIALASFKSDRVNAQFDPVFIFTPTLENYIALVNEGMDSQFVRAFLMSCLAAVVSTVIAVMLSIMGAYALARLRPRGGPQMMVYVFALRMLPPVAIIVPLFTVASGIRLFDNPIGIIAPYVALAIPLGIWILYGFFLDLPRELEEAAMVDGATRMQAFIRIVMPLTGPGIAAVSIFTFALSWNDLVLALVMTRKNITLPVLASMVRTDQGIHWGQLGALTVLLIVPMVIFTALVQRWIVSGLAGGAVKG
jgi:multiple sugar transport system permease protein